LNFAAQGASGDVWAPLMEKVWAKVSGNYEYVVGGTPKEAFTSLLGSPGITYTMSSTTIGYSSTDSTTIATAKAKAWSIISSADTNNYILGCSVGTSNSYGLPSSHAYSLLGAYTITDSTNTVTNKLYKIRNPWGSDFTYTGNWNDADTTHWTAAAIAQTGFTKNTADGIFWVEDSDFVQAFTSFVVSYYTDSYSNSYKEVLTDTAGTVNYF
jgi:Calpain family cysteine protease